MEMHGVHMRALKYTDTQYNAPSIRNGFIIRDETGAIK